MLFLVLCTFSEDEQVWIEQLFNENHTLLYKVSYQLLQSETDAEDACCTGNFLKYNGTF